MLSGQQWIADPYAVLVIFTHGTLWLFVYLRLRKAITYLLTGRPASCILWLFIAECDCGGQADLCKQDDGVCYCNTRGVVGKRCTQYVTTLLILC